MKKMALWALLLACGQGCIGYPRPYFTRVKGKAALDDGKPIRIQAACPDCAEPIPVELADGLVAQVNPSTTVIHGGRTLLTPEPT